MPRTAPLDIDTLAALGADKLARLIADEADGNPGFRKRVKAALGRLYGALMVIVTDTVCSPLITPRTLKRRRCSLC